MKLQKTHTQSNIVNVDNFDWRAEQRQVEMWYIYIYFFLNLQEIVENQKQNILAHNQHKHL